MPATIVDSVKDSTDPRCHATSCNSSGCSLAMAGVPQPYILVNLESEFSPADKTISHCDYLFVGGPDNQDGGPWIAPVELGNKKVSVLLNQLRGGAAIVAELLSTSARVKFKPIFVHSAGLHRQDTLTLRKSSSKVKFGTANVTVQS